MHLKLDLNSWIKTLLHKCVPFYYYLLKEKSKKIKERNKYLRPKNLRPAEINFYNNSSLNRQVQQIYNHSKHRDNRY